MLEKNETKITKACSYFYPFLSVNLIMYHKLLLYFQRSVLPFLS